MRVAVDGRIYKSQQYGGITRMFNAILHHISAIDDSVLFDVLTWKQPVQAPPERPNIRVIELPDYRIRVPRLRRVFRHLESRINGHLITLSLRLHYSEFKGAIWQATYYDVPPDWIGPVVLTVYDLAFAKFPSVFSKPKHHGFLDQIRDSAKRASVIICISETTRQDVMEMLSVPIEKTRVVRPACDDVFRILLNEELDLPSELPESFVLNLGNRSPNKNFSTLLRAFGVWKYRFEIPLVVIGRPWSNSEQELIDRLNLQSHVLRFDSISDDRLVGLYNSANAFVYPSLYEGFGIPLLEAMACGCPLVASRIPSTLEVADDVPYYFDSTSIEELCAALDQAVAEGRDSARTIRGEQRVRRFSWERAAEETLHIYKDIY